MELPVSASDPKARVAWRSSVGQHDLESVAAQARERFLLCMGQEVTDWQPLPEENKARWLDAAWWLITQLNPEVETHWRKLARGAARAYHMRDQWSQLSRPLRLAFEVVARHVCNIVFSEDGVDMKTATEFDWRPWLLAKLEELPDE